MSKYEVFYGPYFPAFGLNTEDRVATWKSSGLHPEVAWKKETWKKIALPQQNIVDLFPDIIEVSERRSLQGGRMYIHTQGRHLRYLSANEYLSVREQVGVVVRLRLVLTLLFVF